MGKKMSGKLSYANVMATLALFIALGGSSYAAVSLSRGSVGSIQLKRNAVTNTKINKAAVSRSKIRNNAVSSAQVANNSLTGDDINESTLAQVPSAKTSVTAETATKAENAVKAESATSATNATNATNASSASTLGGKTAAQLTLGCQSGTTTALGLCFETNQRTSATFTTAAETCGVAGGFLAAASQLYSASLANKITISGEEWSGTTLTDGTQADFVNTVTSSGPASSFPFVPGGGNNEPYRCVYLPAQP